MTGYRIVVPEDPARQLAGLVLIVDAADAIEALRVARAVSIVGPGSIPGIRSVMWAPNQATATPELHHVYVHDDTTEGEYR